MMGKRLSGRTQVTCVDGPTHGPARRHDAQTLSIDCVYIVFLVRL